MEGFEFDERKSRINLLKHGIDFIEAQAIWRDDNLAEIPARFDGEERSIVIGKYEGVVWTAVITYRALRIRIISVRKARVEEVRLYES